MKFRKIVETSLYSSHLEKMKEFYVDKLGLENMKNPNVQICPLIENKMNEIIDIVNQTYSIFEADKLHSELRILDWILYQVCINQK
jgi:catechol 2,3-dioxygenase-like lactoylglutathione lyase family enzyme